MNKIKNTLIGLGVVLSLQSYSQHRNDINPPVGILPMEFNGGFAGATQNHRIVTGIGFHGYNQQPTYFLSYDKFVNKIRSGIGFQYRRDFGSNIYTIIPVGSASTIVRADKFTQDFFTATVSPKFSFKGKYTVAPFVDYTLGVLTPRYPDGGKVMNHYTNSLRVGILFNSNRFYIGGAANLYNTLEEHSRITFQAGYTFQKLPTSHFSFTPQLVAIVSPNYRAVLGQKHKLVQANSMFRYKKFLWSVNSLNFADLGLGIGMQHNNLRIHVNVNSLVGGDEFNYKGYGSGSLTLRYIFTKKGGDHTSSMF